MKKLNYVLAAAAMTLMAGCGNKAGYVITGTVEGAADGDSVFLQAMSESYTLDNIDSTVIKDGKFVFEGKQDSAVYRIISCNKADERVRMDLFLENGAISVNMGSGMTDSATGTASNDAYQQVRNKTNAIEKQVNELQTAMRDTTLTEEQQLANAAQMSQLEKDYTAIIRDGIKSNIQTLVGVQLFKSNYYEFTTQENAEILALIPESLKSDAGVQHIKDITEKQMRTAAGCKFVDVELQTPAGEPVKLSDYVGKGKIVLVDFWASWCGPCRREMPNIVEIYEAYKGDKFEIVGISLDDNSDKWQSAIKSLNITWPQMSDLQGWKCIAADIYAVNSIPHTMLVDADGTIIARGLHGEELRAKVDELMK